jgi:C_GCAxxG_C_C family probable redox protein
VKGDLSMPREEEIAKLFAQGFDCGQVVLTAASERIGLDAETAAKLDSGLGGGMFRGQTCGAVTGAILALGMKYGHYGPNMPERKNQVTAKAVEFQQRFMEKYSSTVCRELLGYDISRPDELNIVLEKGLLFSFCPKATAVVIDLLEDLL